MHSLRKLHIGIKTRGLGKHGYFESKVNNVRVYEIKDKAMQEGNETKDLHSTNIPWYSMCISATHFFSFFP
ncbi:hypothetical protein J6TS7_57030 [Paenibacillus dendritiformis]|nr:hypothetical protein J6TS7_57030 [Paenibacillus dendritiformis]